MTHTIFRPDDLAGFGGQNLLPIIAYGNGGCVNSPDEVLEVLSEVASHGFLVVAIGPVRNAVFGPPEGFSMTDSKLMLDAINWAIAQNSLPGSPYYGKLAVDKIAVMGQSCGGLQALTVSSDSRITTTVCLNSGVLNQPMNLPANLANPPQNGNAPRVIFPSMQKADLVKIHAPVLYLLGGEYDMATPNGTDDFNRIEKVPVVAASYDFTEQVKATGNKGLGHYPATYRESHGGDFTVAVVAWLKWQLKGDQEAAKMYKGNPCGLEKNVKWKVERKNVE
jgi:dienelactone hydrolase